MNLADLAEERIDWRELTRLNVESVRREMEKEGIAALIACTNDNWRYLTGLPTLFSMAYFTVNLCVVLEKKEFPILLPLEDLAGDVQTVAPWFTDVHPLPFGGTREPQQPLGTGVWIGIISRLLARQRIGKRMIALDPGMPFCWKDDLARRLPAAEFVDGGETLRRARLVKNQEEQKAIRRACVIGEIGVQAGLRAVRPGRTEAQVAAVVEYHFRANGGEYPHSTPFVVAGDHPSPGLLGATNTVIRCGEFVRIDAGCSYGGYLSDFSRSLFVGEPDAEARSAYDAVHEALTAGVKAARPGVTNTQLHEAIDSTLRTSSRNRYRLGWFSGHGLGVGLHEDPMIGREGVVEQVVMQPGMYFCMEPAIVVKGKGMIGLEDDYLMTENGVETLTHTEFGLRVT